MLYHIWSTGYYTAGGATLTDRLDLRMSAPSMRTSADICTHPCGRPYHPCGHLHRSPQRCPPMSALMSADVRGSLRTTADPHMEILRRSAQKKFPACVDLQTKRPNTPQTSAGKCPQFSMRNITFFADISGTGFAWNVKSCFLELKIRKIFLNAICWKFYI